MLLLHLIDFFGQKLWFALSQYKYINVLNYVCVCETIYIYYIYIYVYTHFNVLLFIILVHPTMVKILFTSNKADIIALLARVYNLFKKSY